MPRSTATCPICESGGPRDQLAALQATWVTAPREAPLPGYVCVVSKIHVVEPFQLHGEERHAFWDDVCTVAEAVQRAVGSPKLNYEIHGNTVPHVHLHVYPRYLGDPYEGQPIDPYHGQVFRRSDDDLRGLRQAIAHGVGPSSN